MKQLVDLHGGSVDVASTGENQGTTFVVNLPRAAQDQTEVPHVPVSEMNHQDGSNLQSVDLTGLNTCRRRRTRRMPSDQMGAGERHAEVMTATSAAEALPLLEADRPDIVISDIGMPDVDGYEFLKPSATSTSRAAGRRPRLRSPHSPVPKIVRSH